MIMMNLVNLVVVELAVKEDREWSSHWHTVLQVTL